MLVTIGTGSKVFSTGFDFPYWLKSYEKNFLPSAVGMQELMARLLELPIPSLCVLNGAAFAAGYFMSLCHDQRTMNEAVGRIRLPEIDIGMPLSEPYFQVCKAKLPPSTFLKATLGHTFIGKAALAEGLVDQTFSSFDQL